MSGYKFHPNDDPGNDRFNTAADWSKVNI